MFVSWCTSTECKHKAMQQQGCYAAMSQSPIVQAVRLDLKDDLKGQDPADRAGLEDFALIRWREPTRTCTKEGRRQSSIQGPPALMPHDAAQSMHCASVGRVHADATILH